MRLSVRTLRKLPRDHVAAIVEAELHAITAAENRLRRWSNRRLNRLDAISRALSLTF